MKDFKKTVITPSGVEIEVERKNGLVKRTIVGPENWPLSEEDEIAFARWFTTPEDEVGYGVPE